MGSVSYLNHIHIFFVLFIFAMGLAVHKSSPKYWFCQVDLLVPVVKIPKLNYPQVQLQFFFLGGFTSFSNQGFNEILYLDFVTVHLDYDFWGGITFMSEVIQAIYALK